MTKPITEKFGHCYNFFSDKLSEYIVKNILVHHLS